MLSIKEQTYRNIELVVVDKFSTDRTPEIAKNYTDKFFQQGPERCAQRNRGFKESHGEYVVFIDSDMKLSPGVIASCVEKMVLNHKVVGLVIPEESFGEGFWSQCKKLERSFYVGVDWMEAARFFRREVFESVGGYDERMVSGEDWDLSQRIEEKGKIDRVPDFIFHDEGRIELIKTIQKKMYYAKEFRNYTLVNVNNPKINKQKNIILRYWLFFKKPVRLFQDPILGFGMLIMKTCEIAFGALIIIFYK